MKEESSYRFNASISDNANRFVLDFGSMKNNSDKELPVKIYSDGSKLVIDLSLVSNETNILVYDLSGRVLLKKRLQDEIQHKLNVNSNTQLLMVYLKNKSGSLKKKLL